jgi:membrane protease YdiL (CAAX protease family)
MSDAPMSDAPAPVPLDLGLEVPPPPPESPHLPAPESQPAPPPPPPPPSPAPLPQESERYPFWSYGDLILFAGLTIPCMLLGLGLVKLILWVFHIHSAVRVVELLPEQFLGYVFLFWMLLLIFRLEYDRPFWSSLAWTTTQLPWLWMVIAGISAAYIVAAVSNLFEMPAGGNPMMDLLSERTSLILMAIFGVAVAPLCEELAFRGFLQPLLVRSLGAIPGILLAAIPFGLLHFQEYGRSWRHVVLISLAGALFGWMRHATGSTMASTVMHAAYNSLGFFALFVQRKG